MYVDVPCLLGVAVRGAISLPYWTSTYPRGPGSHRWRGNLLGALPFVPTVAEETPEPTTDQTMPFSASGCGPSSSGRSPSCQYLWERDVAVEEGRPGCVHRPSARTLELRVTRSSSRPSTSLGPHDGQSGGRWKSRGRGSRSVGKGCGTVLLRRESSHVRTRAQETTPTTRDSYQNPADPRDGDDFLSFCPQDW